MPKPILTDEMIDSLRRDHEPEERFGYYKPQAPKGASRPSRQPREDAPLSENAPLSHRRMEMVEKSVAWRKKVNRWLFWLIVLVALLIWAVFYL